MEEPSREHGSAAYVPAALEPEGEDAWPPASRAIATEQARQARLEEGGLPVDDATLERDEGPSGGVDEYLRRHPEIDGGTRLGWRDGRRTLFVGLVGDAEAHKAPLLAVGGGRVEFESVSRTVRELETLAARIMDDRAALQAAGFDLMEIGREPQSGVVRVTVVGGRDAALAEAHFAARYGDAVAVEWLGPSRHREVPHPFGSWTAEGRTMRVFFGLDHNGQRRGEARVAEESSERIVVALTRLEPVGYTTLIGGFERHHADLRLREPVGERTVIDASAGVARPSLAQLRDR